ncbi:hypothetical protein RI030_12365 [Aphanizomenon flos-aquae NRERC-008]|uniref:Uncharacterized protein n=1 Tax=Aphanizomenon flos-aquae FACHB-1249 TaxID=2692889 RepID=A0ABR8IRQ0_APHFL|nr:MULTISPECIES: hypothetical protein [Aphanizomenon]MBD2392587.1 hypothetical protein [Aphanizomenon flos-aquae FACHB-1171]MBD2558918.1 hypothetical protein [Aphanizomenon flos-aquae FACHB-1290]MBD2631192.1 hypothetical protein [Aphanizomenon sp. FACHB-1399]MBD2644551.1 hypothetical protein [Aphanizomenon sp. FACHB-1401]MBD2656892.1 hypothetical protein [Aphanizomenon flos-aquae FACHB-1265]
MAFRQKGRQKSSQNSRFSKIKNFIITKSGLIQTKFNNINNNFNNFLQQLPNLKKYLIRQQSSILVIILLAVLCIITIAAIAPGNHTFEGNLIFQEMSFTYNEPQPKVFLRNIKNIQELEKEGIQTLTFTGSFESQLPEINKSNSLEIQLPEEKSKIIISPANSQTESDIKLEKLQLQPQTRITKLHYDFERQGLAFSLVPNSENHPNSLEISLGQKPVKVTVAGYKIPSLNLPKSPDDQEELEFIVTPDNPGLNLKIQEDTNLYLTLSKPPKKSELNRWFKGKIQTKNVKFTQLLKDGNDPKNDLEISTIIEGKIRMVEQDRDIKENQFLMGENSDKPLNIQVINNMQIIPEKKGIEARFSGKTKKIQIGLDQDFPVSSIQGSWLDGVLPRDAIIALFSFGAATVANLLSWLFANINSRKS